MSLTPYASHDAVIVGFPDEQSRTERDQVSEIQRTRILAAMVDVASSLGAGNATVARVVARSGVSRRTFYELFVDREDCFLAAFEETVARMGQVVMPAYEQSGSWRSKIRNALAALLEFLEREPTTARLVVAETLGAGPGVLERRSLVLARIVTVVEEGRRETKRSEGLPPLTAEGIVGGVLSLIHSRLLAAPDNSLVEILNPLMFMIVLPYLGPDAARRELTRPIPKATTHSDKQAGVDPLRDLEMRLTYRTVRVLLAIGVHPGYSNRQIADASGIRDQGQTSKLLARLEHLGLIRNTANSETKGVPNRWTLTERGSELQRAISTQSGRS